MINLNESISLVVAYEVKNLKLKSIEIVATAPLLVDQYSYYFKDIDKTKFEFQFTDEVFDEI